MKNSVLDTITPTTEQNHKFITIDNISNALLSLVDIPPLIDEPHC